MPSAMMNEEHDLMSRTTFLTASANETLLHALGLTFRSENDNPYTLRETFGALFLVLLQAKITEAEMDPAWLLAALWLVLSYDSQYRSKYWQFCGYSLNPLPIKLRLCNGQTGCRCSAGTAQCVQLKSLLVQRQRQLLLRGGFQFFSLFRYGTAATDALMAVPHSASAPSLAVLCVKVGKLQQTLSSARSSAVHRSVAAGPPPPVPTPPQLAPQRHSGQQASMTDDNLHIWLSRRVDCALAAERPKRLSEKAASHQELHSIKPRQSPLLPLLHVQPQSLTCSNPLFYRQEAPAAVDQGSHMYEQRQHCPNKGTLATLQPQQRVLRYHATSGTRQHHAVSAHQLSACRHADTDAVQSSRRGQHQDRQSLEQKQPKKLSGNKRNSEQVDW